MTHSFSISEAFAAGWRMTRAHSGLIFQMMLTLFALEVVSAIVGRTLHGTLIGSLATIALDIVGLFIGTGLTLIFLRIARGERAHYKDLFPDWRVVLNFLCANILAALVVLVPVLIGGIVAFGLITTPLASYPEFVAACIVVAAAIVLALYLALRYSFVRFAVLDGARIQESLSRSAVLSAGLKWRLFFFLILLVVLNLIGAILLLVGLLLTVPISMLAYAHIYVKLDVHHRSRTAK